jgi:hypothetical protein
MKCVFEKLFLKLSFDAFSYDSSTKREVIEIGNLSKEVYKFSRAKIKLDESR